MIKSDVKNQRPGEGGSERPAPGEHGSGGLTVEVSAAAGLEIINDAAKPKSRRYPHAGHRERERVRLEDEGIESFSDERLLEFLLFGVIPRADTHTLADVLLDVFGTVQDVFTAPYEELVRIRGIGGTAAAFMRFVFPFARRAFRGSVPVYYAAAPAAMGRYLLPRFAKEDGTEAARLLCLGEDHRILGCILLARGEPDHVKLNVTRIMEAAVNYKAPQVVLAHNHPNGIAIPSRTDIASTVLASEVLAASDIGVELVDHIILGDGGDFVSLRDSGVLPAAR